jgi:O-antigen ligase
VSNSRPDAQRRPQFIGALLAAVRDRAEWMRHGDWLAVAVAVVLPWSTSWTLILALLWWIARIAMRDHQAALRDALTPAGALPLALAALGALGLLWAQAPWPELVDGITGFYKLLFIPLLLSQFRRSERGSFVLIGFLASCTALVVTSWGLALLPGLTWRGRDLMPGVATRDYIAQGQVFTLCLIGSCEAALLAWHDQRRRLAIALLLLALVFLTNMLYVAPSRTALVTMPVLLLLFALLRFGWRVVAALLVVIALAAAAAWETSALLRARTTTVFTQLHEYQPGGSRTSVGERLEFWRKSITMIADAPVLGHGTGSIRAQFRRLAGDDSLPTSSGATNPHSQIFAMAIQLGLVGTALMFAMWIAHLLLFRGGSSWAVLGIMVVTQNIIGSLFNSHLFDFAQGWLYVWGVGVLGGMALRARSADAAAPVKTT